jgi:hypothetical protein
MRQWAGVLRRKLPPTLPVRVLRAALRDEDGTCQLVYDRRGRPDHFRILIRRGIKDRSLLWHVLVHEYAHALTWGTTAGIEHHGDDWGIMQARVYRALEDWQPPQG